MGNEIANRKSTDLSLADNDGVVTGAIASANESRAISEVQAAVIVAKRFPRDEAAARDKILTSCARPSLAEKAVFSYARGGSDVTGVTIRLAEEAARLWKNIDYGWRTIEQRFDESTIEAFAVDLENNVRRSTQFTVSHRRHTKKGDFLLTDPRDIYEMQANQAARRVRACILSVIPGDIIEDARDQCEQTMNTNVELTPDKLKSLVGAFAEIGVTLPMLEKRIQRKLDAIQPAQVVQLRKVYNSLRDGMSEVGTWFEVEASSPSAAVPAAKGIAGVKAALGAASMKDQAIDATEVPNG
jgi:hypothetical protein